jgi:hypothetical protein
VQVIHEMRQVGAQEWACPTCGRRVLLTDPSALTVLEPGDESAVHLALTSPAHPAAPNPGEPYGLGPVQQVPRPPSLPSISPEPPGTAATDRAGLAGIGIDWDDGEGQE